MPSPDVALPSEVDALVVGAGPGGLSAATWLARHRRSVLVVDSGEQRNRWVTASHGYLGADPTDPSELLEAARRDLGRYGTARRHDGTVATLRHRGGRGFDATLDGGGGVRARRVVLATGVVDEFPDLPRFFDFYGRTVLHCPSCDGYEARGADVVAVGWSRDVAGFAAGLLEWASSVTILTDGRRFEGDRDLRRHLGGLGVAIHTDDVVELCGDDGELQALRLRSGRVQPCRFAFFTIAHHPRGDLARQLGCELTPEGCVVVDERRQTSVQGVYAAGDVTPGMQYVQRAAADGAVAGTACALSLRDELLAG
ncbi:MAG: NAD(P)/FAD-dependent oxidoreductase [Euzebyales bacterium]|nr:NAD(P)/FAD-dependent oxidoreductase [Euzebyales bacterium]